MNARSPSAFMLSAIFHAGVVGMMFLFGAVAGREDQPQQRILELVAGEGDNFGATVAPKLGTEGGIKLDVTEIPPAKTLPLPEPDPTPPAPEPQPEPTPTPPAPKPEPVPTPPTKTEAPVVKNFAKDIRRKAWAAEAKAKKQVAKERAEEAKKMKKEEFDRLQREKNKKAGSTAKGSASSAKIARIDAEGIAKGVVGGSAENKVGGAGGKALVADGDLMDRYFSLLKQRALAAIDKPPGISDSLEVTVVVNISASGRLSGAKVVRSSGSDEWDQAVLAALGRVTMPEHPEKKGEPLRLTFRTKDAGND